MSQQNIALKNEQEELSYNLNKLKEISNNLNSVAHQAFESYCDTLDTEYREKDEEYNKYQEYLTSAYQQKQDYFLTEIDKLKKSIEDLAAMRASALEAQLREKEIKEQKEFYSLKIPENDLKDAKILRDIEYKLSNPRVLRMLI